MILLIIVAIIYLQEEERQADLFSLALIYKYAANQFCSFDKPEIFMEQYGILYKCFMTLLSCLRAKKIFFSIKYLIAQNSNDSKSKAI